jgi:hypothetical protein
MNFSRTLYERRRWMLYSLLGLAAGCCGIAVFHDSDVWLNRAGLIADIAGLVQLEISGFFDELAKIAFDLDAHGENIPSRYVREIIDTPEEDQTTLGRLDEFLKRSPKAGVLLIGIGCTLQLIGTFF